MVSDWEMTNAATAMTAGSEAPHVWHTTARIDPEVGVCAYVCLCLFALFFTEEMLNVGSPSIYHSCTVSDKMIDRPCLSERVT